MNQKKVTNAKTSNGLKHKSVSIRMSGLGGQGVITAAHIIGGAAVLDGKFSTVNPFFGAEKRLAPAESYVRISENSIYERGEIVYPDITVIFHPHVITLGKSYTMPFYDGLKSDGIVIINAESALDFTDEDKENLKNLKANIFYVPATSIALSVAKTELSVNMAMMGALLGVTKIVSMENLEESLKERFGKKKFIASATTAALDDAMKTKFAKTEQLIERNMAVVKKAVEKVKKYTL
ncbi:2-oxoacid:acceptor oxidoreductase family protein [bacterium]|nr:2-oxoacid:acceptor oxidoreductase family protein [bacterium]MBU3929081.1 2-oxoacid:acceptor oxidoreductase family protein [bacterium]